MDSRIKRTAIAIAVATALALPGAAFAQTAKEKELEARVAELEKLVQEMMAAKPAAPAPAAQPAAAKVEAPTVKTGTGSSLTIKGFVVASLFAQDQNFTFGNGQNAEFPAGTEFTTDKWFMGGDLRNTRITLDWKGPDVEGLKVGGAIEADFFGGFNGSGAFSDEQQIPRLRLAYVDVMRGDTTFRIGQFWSPLFGNVPVSPTHVAFPLGYGAAGDVGWRFPGLFIYHKVNDMTKLSFAAMRGSWSGPIDNNGPGEAGTPQFEARVDFSGKAGGNPWGLYLVGHYDQKDLSGPNASAPNDSLDGTAVELGGKFGVGNFSLQGNVYQGKAIGQQFGAITQFGDIESVGGWIQGSLKFTPTWSGNLFYGLEDPKDADVFDSGNSRLKNEMYAASVMYSKGPYVFGVEWMHDKLTTGSRDTAGTVTKSEVKGNQISFSTWYKF